MLRLRMWTRIGLVALLVAVGAVCVTVSASPTYATTLSGGSKTADPGGDPSTGGGSNVGDPDGPTGDISPTGGTVRGNIGTYGTAVQSPTVSVATPTRAWTLWSRIQLALHVVLRLAFLRL